MLRSKVDSSFNVVYWNMDAAGVRGLGGGRGGRDTSRNEPGGLPVDPGVYKAVISLGKDLKDSLMITVNDDPNAPTDKGIRDATRKYVERLDKSTQKLVDLSDRLTEAEEVIKKVEATYTNMDKKDADSLRSVTKKIKEEIKDVKEDLTGKVQEKQGYGQVPQVTVSGTLQEARGNVVGKNSMPGAQEDRLIAEAELQVAALIKKGNNFFNGSWKMYQKLVEASPVKLFKDYKTIE